MLFAMKNCLIKYDYEVDCCKSTHTHARTHEHTYIDKNIDMSHVFTAITLILHRPRIKAKAESVNGV